MRFSCIPLDALRDFAERNYTCELSLETAEDGEVVYKVAGLQAGTVRPALDIVVKYYEKRRGLWRPAGPPPDQNPQLAAQFSEFLEIARQQTEALGIAP